jgi:hypothetical protein
LAVIAVVAAEAPVSGGYGNSGSSSGSSSFGGSSSGSFGGFSSGSSGSGSGSGNGYSDGGEAAHVPQTFRNVYVFSAPDEPEERQARTIRVPGGDKHVNIIFVKVKIIIIIIMFDKVLIPCVFL